MRCSTKQHTYYCGIDLHARSLYICIVDQTGDILIHRHMKTSPEAFLQAIAPYREDICVAGACLFTWSWLADVCAQEHIPFVLGHALSRKAIPGGKSKNEKIESQNMALLLRGGAIPMADVYPQDMRATRDLLRRRMYLRRQRSELLPHIQNTHRHYPLPEFGTKIAYKANRSPVAVQFTAPRVRKTMAVDLELLDFYEHLLTN